MLCWWASVQRSSRHSEREEPEGRTAFAGRSDAIAAQVEGWDPRLVDELRTIIDSSASSRLLQAFHRDPPAYGSRSEVVSPQPATMAKTQTSLSWS
jgi:hypothetical protein